MDGVRDGEGRLLPNDAYHLEAGFFSFFVFFSFSLSFFFCVCVILRNEVMMDLGMIRLSGGGDRRIVDIRKASHGGVRRLSGFRCNYC